MFSFFILAELAFTAFNRSLALFKYDKEEDSHYLYFIFWTSISFIYLILNITKYNFFSQGNQSPLILIRYFIHSPFLVGSLIGSKLLHNMMYRAMLRAPSSFFDKVSSGSLINKFSNDINILDTVLNFSAVDSIEILFNFCTIVITVCYMNLIFIPFGILELSLLLWFMHYNKEIIVSSKHVDLINKSPVFGFFQ